MYVQQVKSLAAITEERNRQICQYGALVTFISEHFYSSPLKSGFGCYRTRNMKVLSFLATEQPPAEQSWMSRLQQDTAFSYADRCVGG